MRMSALRSPSSGLVRTVQGNMQNANDVQQLHARNNEMK
jgi:hypothetical protein